MEAHITWWPSLQRLLAQLPFESKFGAIVASRRASSRGDGRCVDRLDLKFQSVPFIVYACRILFMVSRLRFRHALDVRVLVESWLRPWIINWSFGQLIRFLLRLLLFALLLFAQSPRLARAEA